jgi:phage terminase large subunit-like protein
MITLPPEFNPLEMLDSVPEEHRERFLYYHPYPQQKQFHAAGKEAKERLFMAANRFGKTYATSIEVCMHLTGQYPEWWNGYRYESPVNVWVASISREATRDILQKKYYIGDESAGAKGLLLPYQIISKSYGSGVSGFIDTAKIQHSSGGVSTLSFKSFDQGMEKFQGTERNIIHLDEEPPREIYMECLLRTMATRSDFYGMMLLSMVPLKGATDMVKRFTDNRLMGVIRDQAFWIGGTWEEAPHMNPQEKAALVASMRPHEVEARTKGIPALGNGMVYPVLESQIICKPVELKPTWGAVYGLDFGWNPSPTAALFGAYDRDNDVLYFYQEYGDTEKTPSHHAAKIWDMGGKWIPGVCDPAGKMSSLNDGSKLIDMYRAKGLRLSPADNAREEGIMKVLERMNRGGLKIFDTLHKTIAELRMYARDENGNPIKGNDHFMDCMRYIVMSGLGIARSPEQNYRMQHRPPMPDYGPHSWMRL